MTLNDFINRLQGIEFTFDYEVCNEDFESLFNHDRYYEDEEYSYAVDDIILNGEGWDGISYIRAVLDYPVSGEFISGDDRTILVAVSQKDFDTVLNRLLTERGIPLEWDED